jgi:simple sugar transport system permease protein
MNLKKQISRLINISSNTKSNFFIFLFSIGISTIIFSLLIALLGFNVPKALLTLVATSFRSSYGFHSTIIKTIPLIFLSYAFSVPFIIKFFNIGGYGQMMFGGTIATILALLCVNCKIPSYIFIPLLLSVGTFSGGIYASIAGYLKAKYDINTIVSTIMLNFVSLQFLDFIATNHLFKDPVEGHPITKPLPANALMGYWKGFPYSTIFALISIFFIYFIIKKTKIGYEISAVGNNPNAAKTYGVNLTKTIIWSFFIGGCLAGLAGTLETININGKLIEGFASTSGAQYGMFGILTALTINGDPIGIPFASFFMAILLVGADALQRTMQVPVEIVFISQALIVIIIVTTREAFNKRR